MDNRTWSVVGSRGMELVESCKGYRESESHNLLRPEMAYKKKEVNMYFTAMNYGS